MHFEGNETYKVKLPSIKRISFNDEYSLLSDVFVQKATVRVKNVYGSQDALDKALPNLVDCCVWEREKRFESGKIEMYFFIDDLTFYEIITGEPEGVNFTKQAHIMGIDKPYRVFDNTKSCKWGYRFSYGLGYKQILEWVERTVREGFTTIKQAKRYDYFFFNLKLMEKEYKPLYDLMGQIFKCFTVNEKERNVTLKIEKFDWDKGAEYYYHKASCLWKSYKGRGLSFSHSPLSFALMLTETFESGETTIMGRAFLYGHKEGGVIFNFYGDLNKSMVQEIWEASGFTNVKDARESTQKKVIGLRSLYLNGYGLKYGDYKEVPACDFEHEVKECWDCEENFITSEGQITYDNRFFCQSCYDNNFAPCASCENIVYSQDLCYSNTNATLQERVCQNCFNIHNENNLPD